MFLANPVVAALIELHRQLFGALFDDLALVHHVNAVGDDVVQEALVVRNYERAEVGAARRVDVSAFELGPYALERRMRFAAQDAAESEYEAYFGEQVRAYIAPCMQRKGYQSGSRKPSQYRGRNHV